MINNESTSQGGEKRVFFLRIGEKRQLEKEKLLFLLWYLINRVEIQESKKTKNGNFNAVSRFPLLL